MATAKVRKTVELPIGLAEALDGEAKRLGVSVTKLIVEACEKLLGTIKR